MFWRFGFHTQPAIDVLLEKDNVTLQEVLDEEDVLQECKSPNRKLIDFITNPNIMQQLFKLITDEPATPAPMETKYRYAMLACEVLVSDVQALNDALIGNEALLADFIAYFERPAPLDPIRTSYLCRVFSLLLQKKTGETLGFLQRQPRMIESTLSHIGTSAVIDLLVRIVSCAENPSGAAAIKWVLDENLIERLASKFDASLHPDVHGNVAQCFSEIMTLVTTVEVLMPARDPVLDRLRSKETSTAVLQGAFKADAPNRVSAIYNALSFLTELVLKHTRPLLTPGASQGGPSPTPASAQMPLSALAPLVEATLPFLDQILAELGGEYTPPGELAHTSFGQIRPFGSRRLKVVEFLSALVQVEDKSVCEHLIKLNVPRHFVELMFQYPLHNFLHYQVYDFIAKAITGSPAVYGDLLLAVLRDAELPKRIVEATKQNDAELESNNGVRRGYMGYLTQLSTELIKLSEQGASPDVKALLDAEQWQDYVNSSYRETRERDTKPLGGQKPQLVDSSAAENDTGMYSSSGRNESDNVQDQMTSSLPTESMVNDDDDDELSYDLEDAHNFRSAGAYGSTYDHNIDIDSDEDNDDEGHMHGDAEGDFEPASNTNFANFDEMEFASANGSFGDAKPADDDSSSEEEDERLLSTITRSAGATPAADETAAAGKADADTEATATHSDADADTAAAPASSDGHDASADHHDADASDAPPPSVAEAASDAPEHAAAAGGSGDHSAAAPSEETTMPVDADAASGTAAASMSVDDAATSEAPSS